MTRRTADTLSSLGKYHGREHTRIRRIRNCMCDHNAARHAITERGGQHFYNQDQQGNVQTRGPAVGHRYNVAVGQNGTIVPKTRNSPCSVVILVDYTANLEGKTLELCIKTRPCLALIPCRVVALEQMCCDVWWR